MRAAGGSQDWQVSARRGEAGQVSRPCFMQLMCPSLDFEVSVHKAAKAMK